MAEMQGMLRKGLHGRNNQRTRVDPQPTRSYRGGMSFNTLPVLKAVHASCAMLTLLLFIWRGRLAIAGKQISQHWMRRVPDSVDALLLGTGVALVFVTGQYPFVVDWITIKLLAVIVYIALGFVVFRFGRTRKVKKAAWLTALAVFACIVWLAVFRQVPAWAG